MTQPLPDRLPDHTAGQRDLSPETRKILAEVEGIFDGPTSYRDETPLSVVGAAPPIPQPGRPPMSSKATDASALLVTAGFFSLCLGGAVALVLHFSADANPWVVGMIVAAPPLACSSVWGVLRVFKRAVMPDEHHHHYAGPVNHEYTHTTNNNRWWGRSSTSA